MENKFNILNTFEIHNFNGFNIKKIFELLTKSGWKLISFIEDTPTSAFDKDSKKSYIHFCYFDSNVTVSYTGFVRDDILFDMDTELSFKC